MSLARAFINDCTHVLLKDLIPTSFPFFFYSFKLVFSFILNYSQSQTNNSFKDPDFVLNRMNR